MAVRQDERDCEICRDKSGNLRFFRKFDKCLLACHLAIASVSGPPTQPRLPIEWDNLLRAIELRLSKAFFLPNRRTYDPLLANDALLVDGLVAMSQEMVARLAGQAQPTIIPAAFLLHVLSMKLKVEPDATVLNSAFEALVALNPGTPALLEGLVRQSVEASPFPRKHWFSQSG